MVQPLGQNKSISSTIWCIDPALTWQWIEKNKIQFRLPHGNRLTITENAKEVLHIVKKLTSPFSFSNLLSWGQKEGFDKEILHSIFATLKEYSILMQVNSLQDQRNKGIFFNLLAFEEKISSNLRADLPYPYFDHVILEGAGILFDSVQKLLSEHQDHIFPKPLQQQRPLYLFCCDDGGYEPSRKANRTATAEKRPTAFLRWDKESLVLGPLYLPGESPCFECFVVRQRASAQFLEELDAQVNGGLSQAQDPTHDFLFDYAVRYIVGRYLSMVFRGLFHLMNPCQIEIWDLVKGQRSVGEVLKVPRCDFCGRVKSCDPVRSVGS